MAQNRYLLVILALLMSAALFAQTDVTLKNGLSVNVINDDESKLVTVMLVCPYPNDFGQEEMADLSLINRLIWRGGSALGRTIEEHEFNMFALRFGGSMGSQLLADAFVINYTMPAELLDEVLTHLTVQLHSVNPDAEEIKALTAALIRQEQSVITSSVRGQIIRQLEKRLWAGLRYADNSYGSEKALNGASNKRIAATFSKIKNPANWELYVKGAINPEELTQKLESTLGTIPGGEMAEIKEFSATSQLGVKLELPARLSSKHAVLAYRIPKASELNQAAVSLLAETWSRSPQFEAFKEDLLEIDANAIVSVGLDLRQFAGNIYIYASWQGDLAQDEVLDRMQFIAEGVRGLEASKEAFESARKSLKIDYYTTVRSSRKEVNRAAIQSILKKDQDDFIGKLDELTPQGLKEAVSGVIRKENSLMLVTVTK